MPSAVRHADPGPAPDSDTSTATDPHYARRWLILGVIGIAQLMVVLDATIVNIALPSAQADLGFSDSSRQWIVTAYALASAAFCCSAAACRTSSVASGRSSGA